MLNQLAVGALQRGKLSLACEWVKLAQLLAVQINRYKA